MRRCYARKPCAHSPVRASSTHHKCADLHGPFTVPSPGSDRHLGAVDCGGSLGSVDAWETLRSIDKRGRWRRGRGALIQIAPAPRCLPFKCLPAEMCTTVASTLLARHNVEKIKTVRPLNTSLNPLQGSRQAGRRKRRRRERLRAEVYVHMETRKSFYCLNQESLFNYGSFTNSRVFLSYLNGTERFVIFN